MAKYFLAFSANTLHHPSCKFLGCETSVEVQNERFTQARDSITINTWNEQKHCTTEGNTNKRVRHHTSLRATSLRSEATPINNVVKITMETNQVRFVARSTNLSTNIFSQQRTKFFETWDNFSPTMHHPTHYKPDSNSGMGSPPSSSYSIKVHTHR